ncbi:MAG: NAD(P)H-dependent oxidoreductase [Coriobacteriia bacterium]|nr:NAD(P)H-dependent oxidoreductase [Coriobacteriia bacterium]
MEKPTILAIVGSLRTGSYNRQLAIEAGRIIADQAEFQLLDFHDVPLFNEDLEHPAPGAVQRVYEAVYAADGIWFFTPEYNHFFSGVLKNLIDWLSRPIKEKGFYVLSGKPAAISGISTGSSGTMIAQDHLVTLISYINMNVMNKPRLVIANALEQTDSQGRLALTSSAPFLERQAKAYVQFVIENKA